MNFLGLVQRTRQECEGVGTQITSVVSQTGEAKRYVDWVQSAWLHIQGLEPDWLFMRSSFTFQTVIGTGDYTTATAGATNFGHWFPDTFRCYLTATGVSDEQFLAEWGYQDLRNVYRMGTQNNARPAIFAIKPGDKSIMLGPKPDAVYTVAGEYQRTATELSSGDTPDIPTNLHMVIVYKAMEYYALFESAPEALSRAQTGYKDLLRQLRAVELPEIELGEPLA